MKSLQIALTKGRLEKSAVALFEQAGVDCTMLHEKSRKLIFKSEDAPYSFILAKAPDVTTYVKHGVADIGIVGKDVLMEQDKEHYEMLDLKIGRCQFCLASTPSYDPSDYRRKIIATKYPTVATKYFRERGEDVEIIKIEGSVEMAPILGLADAIIDIVETGSTLRENGLVIFDTMYDISARLIVNKASLKRNKAQIFELIDLLESTLEEDAK
ncbi:ATP phosphoribosyltransferase catalytic subunit [Listeria weihenstephanensis FSL R9-0317]|uniref:ATP phosphoribosyltransferase n=1 Tax=Listeria weihenstephanensis TaxID=1006155 RepID=A0A1S7FX44_9LIST|nr:ATP phosphoribosyltransferase [Listeria weihenstephanensis]AQY51962.1 ATP phosphoribosyltransferase [Listeria weihenstephanensis]EUJ40256.1 ATP phosphoribosyltransferase catalytic subunit [Listeria weihenstephanensis FSL R9-0317]